MGRGAHQGQRRADQIDALEQSRLQLIFRTSLERVLFERRPKDAVPVASDPKCPRCQSANPKESHFCQICGKRLLPDRPDLEGSLEEIAEANFHHARFAEGMKKCQEVIGLVSGVSSGLTAFRKSVGSMIDSQSRYPLAKLQLDVPRECVEYGKNFEALRDAAVPGLSLHPQAFGERMQAAAAPFTQEQVKAFFERMGAELSKAAKAQWG
ncbi:MAG: zinc ribbon domain-containing protein [Myxococcales bacterium]